MEQGTSGALRLFVAVELPETWRAALAEAQQRLARLFETPAMPRLNWVHPESMHITLKFLGGVVADRLPEIEAALEAAVPESPGLHLRPGEVGYFAAQDRVVLRVLWGAVEGDRDGLMALAGRIEGAFVPLGFPPERRLFEPHVTLARAGDDRMRVDGELAGMLRSLEMPDVPEFVVERVALMRSFLERGGARYERLGEWPRG